MDNKDIKRLIPQRDPIIMVDKVLDVNGDAAVTTLTVRYDNYFIDEDGLLAESGLIEHIAQSASAFAGHKAITAGAIVPPVGYIGEIKKFHCYRRPYIGAELRTTIILGTEIAGVTIITGETRLQDEIIADTQMKIFIRQNN
ncbi:MULTISPECIES: beta-hydroxyacyl-ACP dehydratase [Parabacteroides]|uniref:beta-hydroxyacyl-ACP dehydratase n=1 Tax=Parabacteroides TaxID=375288 RepID=UPI000EFF9C61|nr:MULTISPECIES: beta-hydroxyacyl-ACP dehydratase [Parabacteroides]RHU30487.1 beta-hydroxyacyl-ACP dehydratase [Parabacteroides sp. TM07-1AC]WFE83815.1 beta-hydroxyacyl-ACP dehydratase [Parabacteroides chongii]